MGRLLDWVFLKTPPVFYDALRCCRLDGLSLGHSAVIQRTMHAIGVGSLALVLFGLCPAASSAPLSTIADVAPVELPSAPAPPQAALAASEVLNPQVRAVVEAAEAAAKEADRKAGEARRWQASAQTSAAKAREAAQKAEAKAAGYGVLTGTGSGEDKATWRYAGQVRARKENGFGVEAWSSGERNEGEFLNDEENGAMVSVYPAGTRYEGEFRNAKRSGAGVYTWTDGDHYEGEFSNASRNGYGTYYGAETKAFTAKSGQWVNGRLTGQGIVFWKDGKRSAGSFQNDQLDGYGALFDSRGNVIEQGYYEFGELKSTLH